MKINQVYSLLNDINHQMYGDDALAVNDLSGIVAMGNSVMSGSVDAFYKLLIDRIGKVIIRRLDLELEFPNLMMNDFEFGAAIQKITIDPFDSVENSTYEVTDQGFTPTLLDAPIAKVYQTFFTGADTFAFKRKNPGSQLFTAFTSAEAMGAFIDAVAMAMIDSMTISINNMSRTAINNFIAEKIKAANGIINIADLYNTNATTPVTHFSDAMLNKDFLRFSTNIIRKYLKYITMPNVGYNVAGRVRATARNNMHFFALTEYVGALESFLDSDTWHTEFTSIGGYQEVGYWQGNYNGTNFNDPAAVSSIKVTPSSEEGQTTPTDVEQSGIIAVMADRQAIFTGINKRRSSAFYNPIDDYTIIKAEATVQYCNDTSENGLIFIAEPTTP